MSLDRRQFLESSVAAGALGGLVLHGLADAQALRAADSPANKLAIAVMGVNGRGSALAKTFATLPGSTVTHICDVDQRALDKGVELVAAAQSTRPVAVQDIRRVLDDKTVDAVVVATPDHWHGPATIMACAAGKHVYVEKPACHNPQEGEWMIAAARKHQRVVQVGTQRRSSPGLHEAVQKLKDGAIGRVLFARAWINGDRPSIGQGKVAAVPEYLNWDLWQGPAPRRDYRDNLVHYNWHWFWHWGTGELGNNGVHALDVCRWGMGVDYPTKVTGGGGKYFFQDDQETPDTQLATFDFGDRVILWEHRTWHRRGPEGAGWGAVFYGDQGSLAVGNSEYTLYDKQDKVISKHPLGGNEPEHQTNFLECVRNGGRPVADVEIGVQSTMLCLLGNIAYRTGQTINLDPTTHRPVGNEAQSALWGREYEKAWEPTF